MRYFLLLGYTVLIVINACTRIDDLRYGEIRSAVLYTSQRASSNPGAVRLKTGEITVVFREASETSSPDGCLLRITSENNGKTWSPPDTIASTAWDCRDPSITQLRDGLIYVNFHQSRPDPRRAGIPSIGCFTVRSFDNGKTFTSPRMVPLEGFRWTATSDAILELQDGTLLFPAYGSRDGDVSVAFTVISHNGGETWEDVRVIAQDPEERLGYLKPALIRLPDGRILCLLETDDPEGFLYTCMSEDGGETWSSLEKSGIVGKAPDLLITRKGMLLCVFQDFWPEGISCARSYDWGQTWEKEIALIAMKSADPSPCIVGLEDRLLAAYTRENPNEHGGATDIGGTFFKVDRPATPGGFMVSYQHGEGVHLRWNAEVQAAYYMIYRDTVEAFEPLPGYPFGGNGLASSVVTWYTDVQVDTGRTYYYRVSAVAGTGKLLPGTGNESVLTDVVGVDIR